MDDRDAASINWICPNDRQLMLRSKLKMGWSVKAEKYQKFGNRLKSLTDEEKDTIAQVVKRAELLETQEEERIGRLVSNLENMRKCVFGTGIKQCTICATRFGFLGAAKIPCCDCQKMICPKCSIQWESKNDSRNKTYLCKICAEARDMWKKTGAWFYKGIPKHILPPNPSLGHYRRIERGSTWFRGRSNAADMGQDIDSSSSEEEMKLSTFGISRSSSCQNSSPNSPYADKKDYLDSTDNGLSSRLSKLSSSSTEGTRSKTHNDMSLRKDDSSDSTISKDCSINSNSFIPQIHVEHCEGSSGSRHHSESDRSVNSQQNDDYYDDESSVESISRHGGEKMGVIELSVQYDQNACCLHISLHKAKGLKGIDINGLADPFCKLNLLPIGAKSYRLRTRTIMKTCDPEFNETLTFYGVNESDIHSQSLHILILDDDKYGHDCLGEARFPLEKLKPSITKHLSLTLGKHEPNEREYDVWGEGKCSQGQVVITLLYSTRKRALIVGIVRCMNLLPMDSNGLSDPFVKLWLKSKERSSPKFKTSVRWKNLNPIFNEEFMIDTKITDLCKKSLVITVWDKDPGKTNDYLGSLVLGCESKGERLRQWVDMIKYPDHKHEGIHNLSDEFIRN